MHESLLHGVAQDGRPHPLRLTGGAHVCTVPFHWNPDTLAYEVVTVSGGGVGSEVQVTNFPSSQTVTGPLTDAQLRAAAVAVSGPMTDAQLRAQAVVVSLQDSPMLDLGRVRLWDGTDTALITVAGALTIDGSGVTQPVSASALPLPSGAATATKQDTGNTSLSSIDGKLPALSAGRVPVELPAGGGSLTDTELRAAPVEVKVKTDDPTYYVYVPPMALAQNKIFLAMRNIGAVPVKVRKLFLVNAALAAVTGVGVQWDVDKISAITAGTAVTPQAADSADGALANFTCVHSPTVTKVHTWCSWFTNNDEIGLTGGFPQATIQALGNVLAEGAKMKDITLQQNEGICVKQITSTTVGSYGVLAVVTVGA